MYPHKKTVSMIEDGSKSVTSCLVSKSRKSYFVMWTRFVLGYCNLADEDFVDENVKYIREGFEKRVKSIPFILRIHLSEKFSLEKNVCSFLWWVDLTEKKHTLTYFCSSTKKARRVLNFVVARWIIDLWMLETNERKPEFKFYIILES